jgi:hypothetical protein
MSNKSFLNLNSFKSGKTIKQQTRRTKLRADNNRNKPSKSRKVGK